MDPSLYEAAKSGDVDFLERIRDGDLSIDLLCQKTPKDNNIIHIAAEFKKLGFIKNISPESPLFWATNIKGETPLHVAAKAGSFKVVEFLINHAKMLYEEGSDEEIGAADTEGYKKLLQMTNLEMDTALHVAVRCGNRRTVTLLMQADPTLCSLTNSANESPLFLATSKGFESIARYILSESQICPSFEGINGVTALHAAVTRKSKNTKGIVETMMSKKPKMIKEADTLGWTPLHYAAFRGNLEATRVLMQCDSSASYLLDKSGMSALHVAAYAGRCKVLEVLLRFRPDTCDLLNAKGQTVLHAAVLGGKSNVVRFILKMRNLDGLINETDQDGNTALHLAAIHPHLKIMQILASDRRVDKTAINKRFSKAADIFIHDHFGQDVVRSPLLLILGRSSGVPFFQQQIRKDFAKLESSSPSSAIANKRERQGQAPGDLKRFDTDNLITMLIATVTFAAAFAVPGGFQSDGSPVLGGKLSFQVFVLFNTVSCFLSILVLSHYFIVGTDSRIVLARPATLIRCSFAAMVVAFGSGIFVVLPLKSPLGTLVLSMCVILFMFVIFSFQIVNQRTSRQRKMRRWLRSRKI